MCDITIAELYGMQLKLILELVIFEDKTHQLRSFKNRQKWNAEVQNSGNVTYFKFAADRQLEERSVSFEKIHKVPDAVYIYVGNAGAWRYLE